MAADQECGCIERIRGWRGRGTGRSALRGLLDRHRRRARVDRRLCSCQLLDHIRFLFHGAAWPFAEHVSNSIHPRHGGYGKGLGRLSAVEGIVKTKSALGVTWSRAHGDIVSERDDREEQDDQQQDRGELQSA